MYAQPTIYSIDNELAIKIQQKILPTKLLCKRTVAKTKKVTFRKPLKVTYINWLRELDLNQRPSGYESIKVLLAGVFTCNHNLSEFITNDYAT